MTASTSVTMSRIRCNPLARRAMSCICHKCRESAYKAWMWIVAEREAAAIYAKASLSWYGRQRARSVAHSMIRKLGKKGDLKGVRAWRLVSEELVRIERGQQLSPIARRAEG